MNVHQLIDRLFRYREVGASLAAGPWQALGRQLYGVPAVTMMNGRYIGEIVVSVKPSGVEVVKRERGGVEWDPLFGVAK